MSAVVKWVDPVVQKALEKIERKRIAASGVVLPPPRPPVRFVSRDRPDDIIDLPRRCTVDDEGFYFARYVRGLNGRMQYAQSIPADKTPYQGNRFVRQGDIPISSNDLGIELCPFCAASGSVILCRSCWSFICSGRALKYEYRCCCGHAGNLVEATFFQHGIDPRGSL